MKTVVGICGLLLGSLTLSDAAEAQQPPLIERLAAAMESPSNTASTPAPATEEDRTDSRQYSQASRAVRTEVRRGYGPVSGIMPNAPTEIAAENPQAHRMLTPTERSTVQTIADPAAVAGYPARIVVGSPTTAGVGQIAGRNLSPLEARREAYQARHRQYQAPASSYVDYRLEQMETQNFEQYEYSPAAMAAIARENKPFAGYRNRPAISPYLNIFRLDNENDTVDNYTTLVRPQVDQRLTNARVGGQIRSLATGAYLQGAALRRISGDVRPQSAPTKSSRDYYMSLRSFYPGMQ